MIGPEFNPQISLVKIEVENHVIISMRFFGLFLIIAYLDLIINNCQSLEFTYFDDIFFFAKIVYLNLSLLSLYFLQIMKWNVGSCQSLKLRYLAKAKGSDLILIFINLSNFH